MDNHQNLNNYLKQESTWAIHQFNKDENGNNKYLKELFPQIPTSLVIDFFISNDIKKLTSSTNGEIWLKATGIDDIEWTYLLLPPKSIP